VVPEETPLLVHGNQSGNPVVHSHNIHGDEVVRADGRWGLLITGALTPASLSGGILLLGWLLSSAIT